MSEQAKKVQNEEGLATLARTRRILDEAGIKYLYEISVDGVAGTIAQIVRDLHCDQVVMGTRGMGSVATKVLHLVNLPVTLVK